MPQLKYIELKTGFSDDGPAWIAYVKMSKSRRTVYFDGKALQRSGGRGASGNYVDIETGDEYWLSGVKKDGRDRHPAGGGTVRIERVAVDAYLKKLGRTALPRGLVVTDDIAPVDMSRLDALANRKLNR